MPVVPRKSKAVHLEIRASFESGPMLGQGELVGTFETTFEQLLENDWQPISLSAVGDQCIYLVLRARHSQTTQIVDHTVAEQRAIDRNTDAARNAYMLFQMNNLASDLDNSIRDFRSLSPWPSRSCCSTL